MNKLKILKIGTLVSVVILVAAIIACQSMDYTSSAYQLPYAFVWIGFFMLVIFAFAWGVIANENAPEEHIEVVTPSKDVYNDTAKKYAISLTTPISSYNEESKSDEIALPYGTEEIEDGAFKDCTNLKIILIPDSVTSIGESAFENCTKLESILIPESVTSIKGSAFVNCTNLKSITLPRKATIAGELWFLGCKNLESITIPDGVKSIGKHAFENCTKLESITIPDSVLIIGNSAFAECTNLKSITIPDSVANIGESAFRDCTNLENILIPDSVKSISKRAFENCTKLESITISDGVLIIGNSAFAECTNLKRITIPDSVVRIGESAFSDCTNLENILIPDSVKSIGSSAFGNCTNMTRIIGISGSYAEKWAEENGVEFEAQTSIPNKIQKEKPMSKPLVNKNENPHVPQKAGESSGAMLNKFSVIHTIVSGSHSQKPIPFQKSMKLGIHHITEGVQRIEVMNMWTIDVPTGYEFSLDLEHTGKTILGENRLLTIMIDDGYSDFSYPYQSEINFVVFSTCRVEFHGQPLNSSDSQSIISQIHESVRRSRRNYKVIVNTELINVQYVTIENRKDGSEFNIIIFTQEACFAAQFIFNGPALGKDERVKMVEDWLKTIEPLQKTSRQKNKSPETNTPEALKAQKFKTVSPSKNLYVHYNMLQNQKHGALSRFAEVSINDSGTEFTCLDLDTVVPEDEYLEKVTYEADAGKNNYKCHKAALEMSRVFRVAPNAFNHQQDKEGEIRDKTMKRAYIFSALRSFAWTLGAYQETEGLDEEQISIDVLLQLGEFVKSRDWLNYTDKSHFNGLCDGGDLHMFYLPDKTTPYLVKENVVDMNNVASLDNLRNDLSALEPIMWQIHEHLFLTRDRSQPLSTPLSDVLYAWCVLALAAEKAFFTEDGPMNCGYSQYND